MAAALAVCVCCHSFVCCADIRSVGLRFILPFGGLPVFLGAEVVADVPFGDLSISLFLSPTGETLLLGSADLALTREPTEDSAFLRVTAGLSYFDPSRQLPTLLVGGGTIVRFSAAESLLLGLSAELVYPIAFPVPMLTLSGAWELP